MASDEKAGTGEGLDHIDYARLPVRRQYGTHVENGPAKAIYCSAHMVIH